MDLRMMETHLNSTFHPVASMDFQQLRIFRVAAETSGFTKASEVLELSQSTVSQNIKQLEEKLGCSLFLRSGKKVYLTEAGKLLRIHAERIFSELNSADLSIRELGAVKRGRIRLGVGATTLIYTLPPVLKEFRRRYPQIEFIISTAPTESLLTLVSAQHIDLAIVMQALNKAPTNVTLTPLEPEELVVILNAECPLARRELLDPADLLSTPLILYEKHSAMQNVIDLYFSDMDIEPTTSMELENIEAIKSLVVAGFGASIVPLCSVNRLEASSPICVRRIAGHAMQRRFALATPNAELLPPAIEKLAGQIIRFLGIRSTLQKN